MAHANPGTAAMTNSLIDDLSERMTKIEKVLIELAPVLESIQENFDYLNLRMPEVIKRINEL